MLISHRGIEFLSSMVRFNHAIFQKQNFAGKLIL